MVPTLRLRACAVDTFSHVNFSLNLNGIQVPPPDGERLNEQGEVRDLPYSFITEKELTGETTFKI